MADVHSTKEPISTQKQWEYYRALIERRSDYEGVFYVGVTSTGIFCRPTCPARKPKFEHCEFFRAAQEALLASYRPCKRCEPLSHPGKVAGIVETLVEAVERNPEKRWTDADFEALSVHASTARRQFRKRFGMTFVQYARARRLGIAMKEIRRGESVIEAQLEAGYESGSGFRDAFSRIMGTPPSRIETGRVLFAHWLDTPLGPMLAIADEEGLYLLEFVDRRGLEREIERLRQRTKCAVIPGRTSPIDMIERELSSYFAGSLASFTTPVHVLGTPFQQHVWDELRNIPQGETRSYSDIAAAIGHPAAVRAVGRANGSNQLAIVIPCHRVVQQDGTLGGYGGGLARKQWLLEHETRSRSVGSGRDA
ncbi:bifunctional transcriptional activator/DNA repair enzyme AdaA [Alicyclobacillus suci]|uniref:bifunctional transcriptional activator/DNA repair enzyme AdaA n=1 Tax=Alicyclobacillus suci TaxID=2816080 RepID=UPI0011BEA0D8|nr:trifunctional transcriptional activator/DNA repair protein Ada/methylated-DNA--[protein]-cysteine S-methyltransferase [Alicyclobacillus suci]